MVSLKVRIARAKRNLKPARIAKRAFVGLVAKHGFFDKTPADVDKLIKEASADARDIEEKLASKKPANARLNAGLLTGPEKTATLKARNRTVLSRLIRTVALSGRIALARKRKNIQEIRPIAKDEIAKYSVRKPKGFFHKRLNELVFKLLMSKVPVRRLEVISENLFDKAVEHKRKYSAIMGLFEDDKYLLFCQVYGLSPKELLEQAQVHYTHYNNNISSAAVYRLAAKRKKESEGKVVIVKGKSGG